MCRRPSTENLTCIRGINKSEERQNLIFDYESAVHMQCSEFKTGLELIVKLLTIPFHFKLLHTANEAEK